MVKISATKVANFSGHREAVYTLENSYHKDCFYSAGPGGLIVEWNTETKGDGILVANIGKHVYSLLLDKYASRLLCGTSEGNLHVIDLEQNKEVRNLEAHRLGVFDMKLQGEHLITCGGDGMINIFSRHDFSFITTIKASEKSARVIDINPGGKEFAVGFSDWQIRLYDLESFMLKQTINAHVNSVFALCFSPDGKYLLSGGRDAMLKVWDVKNNYSLILEIPAHTLQIKCIAYNPGGNLIATSSMDKTIKIWDSDHFELLKVIDKLRNESHTNCINKILWMNENEFLTCSDDRQVMMWEVC